MTDNTNEDKGLDAFEPLKSGDPQITSIISKILKLEMEWLYQRQPHLNEDVLKIIKEEIK